MTELSINQKNATIADYMGFEYVGWNDPRRTPNTERPNRGGLWIKKELNGKFHEKIHRDKILPFKKNDLPYHKDWNYLMEVWGKAIKELTTIYGKTDGIMKNLPILIEIDNLRHEGFDAIAKEADLSKAYAAVFNIVKHLSRTKEKVS